MKRFASNAPVALGLRLLLSQSLDDGHRNPKKGDPSEWNGERIGDVLNIEFVGVSLQNIDGDLQRCVDKGINDHAEDTQDDQRTCETSTFEA